MNIAIIDYGAGNVKSVEFAFNRLGIKTELTNNPERIKSADKVIFPGVGHAQFAMDSLKKYGIDKLIPQLTQPVLGICLGMQLMCKHSEEGDTNCLGIFDIECKKFPDTNKIPQMGWNTIKNLKTGLFKGLNEESFMYFVHSFYVPNNENAISTTVYDFDYCSAINKDNFYAVQFHPEKSADLGEKILKNFLEI
jgi:glutamine amidotransferase